jgi:hypothetical protein
MNYADNGENISNKLFKYLPLGDIMRVRAGHDLGLCRIVMIQDDDYNFEDLCGDCYKPEACPDIEVTTLARQKRAFRARVNREGVWGVILQCRPDPTCEWVDVESVWGLVGKDFFESGYDSEFVKLADQWLMEKVDFDYMIGLIRTFSK